MIDFDPIIFLEKKLRHITTVLALIGFIFLALGIAIVFIPAIIQYFFILGFVSLGLAFFVFAIKISHIKRELGKFSWSNLFKK